AWRPLSSLGNAVLSLAALGLVTAAIAGPYYARLFLTLSGSLYDVATVRAGSQEKEAVLAAMLAGTSPAPLRPWIPALQHMAMWGDFTAVFLPREPRVNLAMLALLLGGVSVAAVAIAGAARVVTRPDLRRRLAAPLPYSALPP